MRWGVEDEYKDEYDSLSGCELRGTSYGFLNPKFKGSVSDFKILSEPALLTVSDG